MQGSRQRTDPTPERVGRYDILVPIASGGMATVYLARARGAAGFERDVAIKVTHAHLRESADFARSLVEEAKLAVRVRHSNVVPILDVGDDPLGLFLVMDYVEGDTFSGLMKRALAKGAPLATHVGARILLDALAGLHAAHELKDESGRIVGLVHRDFSPQNILVGLDGISRLTDFGVAKAATRLGETRTGVVKGKIRYMAPEQARGLQIDRRCDVWAAGVIAWELIAGRRLYEGSEEDVGLIFRIGTETPARLRSVRPDVPPKIDEAVARALMPNKEERFATAAEFAKELGRALASSGIQLADATEVGEHVEQAVGARLSERRRRGAEVFELRKKLGRMTEPLEPMTETPDWKALEKSISDRPPSDAVSEEISLHTLEVESGNVLRPPPVPTSSTPGLESAAVPPAAPQAPAPISEEMSGTANVNVALSPLGRALHRASKWKLALGASAAVVGLVLFVLAASSRSRQSPTSPASGAPPSLASATAATAAPASAMPSVDELPSSAPSASNARSVKNEPARTPAAPPRPATVTTAAAPRPAIVQKPPPAATATKKAPNLDNPF
jgi:eukaryotic-like serine/threonine-protein kinase